MIELQHKYFYCYSPTLHKYIQTKHKIKYISAARNEHDNRKFWIYEQSKYLSIALDEYKSIFKGVDVN